MILQEMSNEELLDSIFEDIPLIDINDYTEEILRRMQTPVWRNAEKEKPEPRKEVLIAQGNNMPRLGRWVPEGPYWVDDYFNIISDKAPVKQWMEFPAPPPAPTGDANGPL